jgi:effector-binding domain-containing protein
MADDGYNAHRSNSLSMKYEVVIRTVAPQQIAAVRRRVRIGEVGKAWKPALDLVWAFLGHHRGPRTDGHNCFLYHYPAPGEPAMTVDFGVQVSRPFQDEGEVICTATPAGEVVITTHTGSYAGLAAAHQAVRAWSAASGRAIGGFCWEIYGDWTDDETKLETQVVYLLS